MAPETLFDWRAALYLWPRVGLCVCLGVGVGRTDEPSWLLGNLFQFKIEIIAAAGDGILVAFLIEWKVNAVMLLY